MHQIIVEEFTISPHLSVADWFQQLQHLPGSVMLHSGDSEHQNAEFHIATALPLVTISIDDKGDINLDQTGLAETECRQEYAQALKEICTKYSDASDSNLLIEAIQDELFENHKISDTDFPFQTGCIGYASYDYGRFLEVLPEHTPNSYQTPVFWAGFYHWSIVFDAKNNETWLCYSEFYGKPELNELLSHQKTEAFRLISDWQSNMSKAQYVDKIQQIHEYLLSGDCYQVNLAQRFNAPYKGCEWQAWQALTAQNQAPFSGFIRLANSCIVSCSPERFLSIKNGAIETKPIKGTRPRFDDVQDDEASKQELISSDKDRAENLMIVDLLRNDISKNAQPHSVEVDGLFEIESFSAVHHMVSTVRGKVAPQSSSLKVVKDAFPGGSITGAPKIRAMEIIDELEPHRRNIYCGSLFFLNLNGDLDSNICIRTLLFENKQVYCWAGGGIVADSDAELEYQETYHKVDKILPTLKALNAK